MDTRDLLISLFLLAAGSFVAAILLKVGRLRSSPHLPFVSEQSVELAQPGSYALWLTGGLRGFWARTLAEVYPDIHIVEASTGKEVRANYSQFPIEIRGIGYYRKFATFAIDRPGRYAVRIGGPAVQKSGASATKLILERRR
jgi:hypothetical protein